MEPESNVLRNDAVGVENQISSEISVFKNALKRVFNKKTSPFGEISGVIENGRKLEIGEIIHLFNHGATQKLRLYTRRYLEIAFDRFLNGKEYNGIDIPPQPLLNEYISFDRFKKEFKNKLVFEKVSPSDMKDANIRIEAQHFGNPITVKKEIITNSDDLIEEKENFIRASWDELIGEDKEDDVDDIYSYRQFFTEQFLLRVERNHRNYVFRIITQHEKDIMSFVNDKVDEIFSENFHIKLAELIGLGEISSVADIIIELNSRETLSYIEEDLLSKYIAMDNAGITDEVIYLENVRTAWDFFKSINTKQYIKQKFTIETVHTAYLKLFSVANVENYSTISEFLSLFRGSNLDKFEKTFNGVIKFKEFLNSKQNVEYDEVMDTEIIEGVKSLELNLFKKFGSNTREYLGRASSLIALVRKDNFIGKLADSFKFNFMKGNYSISKLDSIPDFFLIPEIFFVIGKEKELGQVKIDRQNLYFDISKKIVLDYLHGETDTGQDFASMLEVSDDSYDVELSSFEPILEDEDLKNDIVLCKTGDILSCHRAGMAVDEILSKKKNRQTNLNFPETFSKLILKRYHKSDKL